MEGWTLDGPQRVHIGVRRLTAVFSDDRRNDQDTAHRQQPLTSARACDRARDAPHEADYHLTMLIRRLRVEDAKLYVPLRRSALEQAPFAFGSSPEDDRNRDI